jgi:aminopeptidase
MRRIIVGLLSLAVLCAAGPGGGQSEAQNQQFADKLVNQLLGVRQGNVVVITADPTHLALTEDIATSVSAAGAFPIVNMGSNRINRLYWDRVPARFDSAAPKGGLRLLGIADETVTIDFPNDPSVVQGVPASRLAAVGDAGNALTEYTLKHNIPSIDIGNGIMPSAQSAEQFGVSESVLSSLFWNGLNADYSQIHRDATAVAARANGARVHVTSPNGTNLTLALQASPAELNSGIISAADRARGGTAVQRQLPAGDVYYLPQAGSARGTIVFGDTRVNGTLISGLTVHVAGGKVTSMSAKSGLAMVNKFYAAGGAGRDLFAYIDFGTNRSMRVPAGQWGPGPSMAAGYVTLALGSNLAFGGTDGSAFAFASNAPNATVTLNGKTIIANGALQ